MKLRYSLGNCPLARHFAMVLSLILASGCFVNVLPQSAHPVPFINLPLVPMTTAPGGAAFTLTVNGTGFASGAVVNWNGSPRTTTFVSSSQLTASITATDIAAIGTATVTVSNPGGIPSQPVFFDITNPVSAVGFAFTPTNLGPCSNIAADFNGDGKTDLVACNGTVTTVLLGNGNGTFTALPPISNPGMTPFPPVVTADMNNTGNTTDLIGVAVIGASGAQSTGLITWLGNGDGTFQAPVPSPLNQTQNDVTYASIAVGDFNGDGRNDIAVTNPCVPTECIPAPGVRIFLGNGDGTFQTPITYVSPFLSPVGLAVGDFNHDGVLDLVVSDVGTGNLSILLGNGNGTFQAPKTVGSLSYPNGAYLLASGDLNGDGNLDLVLTNENTVTVFLGNGDGTFSPSATITTSASVGSVILNDFFGDGKLDLVLSSQTGVSILKGNGDGTFQPPTDFNLTSGNPQIGIGDFDQNGRLDLAVTDGVLLQTSARVSRFAVPFGNQGVGTISGLQNVTLTNLASSALTIGSVTIGGANSGDFTIQSNSCGTSVPANGTCTVGITFTPTLQGAESATLAFSDGAAASPQMVFLSGTGVGTAPPAVSLAPTSLTFPAQPVSTTSSAMAVTVANTGNLTLTVNGVVFQGANQTDFAQTNNCSSVSGGGTCTINVTFTPGASGSRSTTMLIADNAANSPQTMAVSGTGSTPSLGLAVPSGSSSSATVQAGGPASYTLAIGGAGMSGTASLTCAGAPAATVCSVPSTITVAAATPSTFAVNVTTTSRSLTAIRLIKTYPPSWLWAVFFLGIAVCTRARGSKHPSLKLAWLIPLAFALFACGGGGGSSSNPNGTPVGTYTLTVTATSGSTSQSANLTLVVH